MKTYQPKQNEVKRQWHLVDVGGQVLGRRATQIATLLMGKHKPSYSSHMDVGDYVVVINAKDVQLTGRKKKQKVYQGHSGYPGGFKEVKFSQMIEEQPEKVVRLAVKRMLPKNRLQDPRMARMKVFAGKDHSFKEKFQTKKKKGKSKK
jgi:large subunit ribosomal protein L13